MNYRPRLLEAVAFYALFVYAGLLLFSINYQAILPGLDSSWAFAINEFAHGPELFGKDIVFTYGPLAYLAVPQHLGSNLQVAAAVHIFVWGVLFYIVALLRQSGQRTGALWVLVGLILSNRLYFDYWDYLLSAIIILALLVLLKAPDSPSVLIILAMAIGLNFLVKFTGFILGMLLLMLYAGSRFLLDRNVSTRERGLLILAFAAGPIAYLIYNPSVTGLWGYLQSSLNLSSGYSAVMSLPTDPDLAWRAALLCAVLVAIAGFCLVKRWVSPAGAAMVIATGWLAFKHGYTRSGPAYAALFFCFIILALVFLLAQIPYTPRRAAVFSLLFAGFSAFALNGAAKRWPVWSRFWWSPNHNLTQSGQLLRWRQATTMLDQLSEDAFRTSIVHDYEPRLAHSRVLFFPWDVSYGAREPFTTVPLFTTQSYAAYTHYLDRQSAEHIAKASPPVDYVLLEWKSVDFRNPVLDVPETWNALFSNFVPVPSQGDVLLLQPRPSPLRITFDEVGKGGCPLEAWAQVPQRNTPVALSLDLKPTLLGKAVTTLYQLGPVNLRVQTRSGLTMEMRIPPDVVSYPFPINFLPLTPPVLSELWNGNVVADPIVRFLLTGSGLKHLRCSGLRFYDVKGTSLRIS